MSSSLARLPVLVIDCQATGPKPGTGHLLELGWIGVQAFRIDDPSLVEPRSLLISLPAELEIPKQVSRVTGIVRSDLANGFSPLEAWGQLTLDADRIAGQKKGALCPTVIHFARYEEAYLRHLHDQASGGLDFPLDIICTWEIVRRLLPQLPRRGLRAVSGYLGHSVPESRRSAHHVIATAFVWNRCVSMLEEQFGITELKHLKEWLALYDVSKASKRYPMEPEMRLAIPDCPGLYRMLRSNGDVLYVGKSNSLKRRVNSYFQKQSRHAEHILEMLTQARSVDISRTDSALEAALLESDEIKDLSPPYNIALRERNRAIAYSSVDMEDFSSEPSRLHRLGPLPSIELFRILAPVWKSHGPFTADQDSAMITPELLGLPGDHAPDTATLLSGLQEFRSKYDNSLARLPTIHRRIASLGFRLWMLRQLESEKEEAAGIADGDQDVEEAKKGEDTWTAERVVVLLESFTSRAAYLLRRARWFLLLSESSFSWQAAASSPQEKHLILIRSGKIADCSGLRGNRQPPCPPGYRKAQLDRQQSFDLATYDRLSVLTTELRRLSGDGRSLMLRLGDRSILHEPELVRILGWL